MKAPIALQRGMACLCCRKRKMKCDGARPVCTQCSKAKRAAECQYYEKKRTSRTQLLQAKITKLEARLRELEAEQSLTDDSSPVPSTSASPRSVNLQHSNDLASSYGFDGPEVNNSTPELDHEFFLSNSDMQFPAFDDESMVASVSGMPWTDDLEPGPSHEYYTPSPSSSSISSLHGSSSGSSSNWWENDVFCENKQMLLDIFLSHRYQCGFDVHVGRFKASLLHPSAKRPHPALIDACLLLGCFFARTPPYTTLEPHFLKRTLRGITDALQHSDRVVHVLQASCLLAIYFFWHGRTLEGYYHSSISARLALGLGLHQIRDKEWFQFQFAASYQADAPAPLKASVPLTPPQNQVEYAERIAAWWQMFGVDRCWAVVAGLPTALPDDDHPRSRIETIWPVPIPDDPEPTMENGSLLTQPFPDSHLSGSSPLLALRMKATVLFERTARYASSSTPGSENRYSLEMSLSQFSSNLSSMAAQSCSLPYVVTHTDTLQMHTLIYTGTIHLYRDGLETQDQSYQKCLWAANAIVAQCRTLTEAEFQFTCPVVGYCWRAAADVYLRIMALSQGHSARLAYDFIVQQLDTLITVLQQQGQIFPLSGILATKTLEEKTTARQAYTRVVV